MASNKAASFALEFAGFNVNITLYSRVKKQRNQSFRMIAPSGQPVRQAYIDSATDKLMTGEPRKGVQVAPDSYAIMSQEAIDKINSGTKTKLAAANMFCPVDSIAWDLAIDRYAVRPDDKVDGSGNSVNVLWNGLRDNGLAYVTQVSLTGGHDGILCLYATDDGFWGAMLPFEDELYDFPTHVFQENAQAGDLFAQVLEQHVEEGNYEVGRFDHSAFVSEYRTRRQAAIDAVLDGREVASTPDPEAPKKVMDLMSVLSAQANKKEKVTA